jgi:hypothetical protein
MVCGARRCSMSNIVDVKGNIAFGEPQYRKTPESVNNLPDEARIAVLAKVNEKMLGRIEDSRYRSY